MEEDTWDYFPCVSHTYLTYTLPHIHNTHIRKEKEKEKEKEREREREREKKGKKKRRESLESSKTKPREAIERYH